MITHEEFFKAIKQEEEDPYKLGAIREVDGQKAKVIFDGEEESTGKSYIAISSYAPMLGDRVVLMKVKGTYIIWGAIGVAKLPLEAPNPPTISAISETNATVSGGVGTEVKIDNGLWRISPHTFTGLSASTDYQAFSRMKATEENSASPSSVAASFTTEATPIPMYTLKNEIVNGDFTQGLDPTYSNVAKYWKARYNGDTNYVAWDSVNNRQIISSNGIDQGYGQILNDVNIGDILYVNMNTEKLNLDIYGEFWAGLAPTLSDIASPLSKINNGLFTTLLDARTSGGMFHLAGDRIANKVALNTILIINLSKSFGVGNEPTKEAMDLLISEQGGYFEGELQVPQESFNQININGLKLELAKTNQLLDTLLGVD